jgi:hypothetical protein
MKMKLGEFILAVILMIAMYLTLGYIIQGILIKVFAYLYGVR